MALSLSPTLRSARAAANITAAGANAKLKFYNGARPATGAAPAGTLLATLVFGATIGAEASQVVTLGPVTQTNANHVAGTPTWARLTTSADVFVADLSIPADLTFAGTVATGVDVILGATTITEPNA